MERKRTTGSTTPSPMSWYAWEWFAGNWYVSGSPMRRAASRGWKKVPEFQARIKENIAALRAKFLECGLARKKRRLAALTDVYHRQQLIVSARGASAERKSHWSHCRTGAVTFMGMSATDIDGEGKQDFVALFARRSAEAHG